MPENSSKLQTCTHSETPASLAVISPKSQTVYLSVHPPHMMLYWKLGKTTPVARLDGHNSSVSAVVIGEDERVVVSGSEAGTVMVWDMAVQRAVGSLKGSRSAVTSIAMGKDEKEGLLAVASADGIVRLWDRRTKETTATVVTTHSGCATAVDISPHGDLLSSGSANGVIALWDIGMQRTIHELDLGGVSPHILMFEPRQEHIVCAGVNRQVTVWSLDTYEQTFETRLSGLIHSLTFTSSSRHFFLSTATEIQAIHTKGWESLGCIEGGLSDILVTRAGPNALVTLTATDTGLDVWSTEVTAISSPDSAPSPCSFPTVSLVPTADEQSQALLEVTGNHAVYMDLLTKKKENLSTVSQWWTDANVNATIGSLAMLKDVPVSADVLQAWVVESSAELVQIEHLPLLLPLCQKLIESKYEVFVKVGLAATHSLVCKFTPILTGSQGDSAQREDQTRRGELAVTNFANIMNSQAMVGMVNRKNKVGTQARKLAEELEMLVWACRRRPVVKEPDL